MGSDHYGDYIYVLAWLNILILPSKMGWDTLLLKYVAVYKVNQEWGKLKGILRISSRIALIQSLLVVALTALIIWLVKSQLNSNLLFTFLVGFPLLPLLVFNSLRQSTLRSLKRIMLSQIPEMVVRPIFVAILAGLLFLSLDNNLNSPLVIALTVIATTISFLIGNYWLNKYLLLSLRKTTPIYQVREWIYTALPLFFISSMHIILQQTDVIMIGFFIETKYAGIYSIASHLASLVIFTLGGINTIFAPMIAELYANQQHSELQKMLNRVSKAIFFSSLPIVIIIILFGDKLLVLFGLEFTRGYVSLLILTCGQFLNALSGSVGFLMTMTGHQKEFAIVIGMSATLNIILNSLLIPIWELEGAALATAMTTAAWNIILVIYIKRNMNLTTVLTL